MPYVEVLQKYADFNGRATRTEFWLFILIHCIILAALILLISLLSLIVGDLSVIILLIYILATYIPTLAVGARRLHDIGRSGWWQIIGIVAL